MRNDTDVGGKPAHAVVGARAGQAVMNGSRAGLEGASAAIGFLSAPVDEPAAEAVTDEPADLDDIDELGGMHGTALLAGEPSVNGNGAVNGVGAFDGNGALDSGGPLDGALFLPEVVIAPEAFAAQARQASAAWDASTIVTEIYEGHYNQLVRLALLLVHDMQTAEEVVQDAFEAMHLAWRRLRDSDKALSYLRQTVVNRSRSVLRHRKVVDMHPPKPAPDEPSAEHAVLALLERSAVVSALRLLPVRQREAIVLRYYADLSEADIAKAMGISRGAVKSHTARAMATLKSLLEQRTP
jgi:RNA polymerase sigma-70 factor (sigma-E family)